MRRFALNDHGLDFQPGELWIGNQVFDLGADLTEPLRIFVCEQTLRHGHQIGRNSGRLHAKQNNPAAPLTRESRSIFQR